MLSIVHFLTDILILSTQTSLSFTSRDIIVFNPHKYKYEFNKSHIFRQVIYRYYCSDLTIHRYLSVLLKLSKQSSCSVHFHLSSAIMAITGARKLWDPPCMIPSLQTDLLSSTKLHDSYQVSIRRYMTEIFPIRRKNYPINQ